MSSLSLNKRLINREFITSLTRETAEDIYRVQARIAQTNRRTGKFYRFLQRKPYHLQNTGRGVSLVMNYLVGIRYADIKYNPVTGAKKRNYTPIYNKIVWGFIYGFLYKQLGFGISKRMNAAIVQRLQNMGYKLK